MENTQQPRRSVRSDSRITSDGFIVRQPRPIKRVSYIDSDYLRRSPLTATPASVVEQPIPTTQQPANPIEHQPLVVAEPNQETLKLDMRLPGVEQLLRKQSKTKFSKWRFMKNPNFRAAATSLSLLLVVSGWILGQAYFNLLKSFDSNGATVVSLQQKVDPNLLKGEGDGRVNILLLGNGGSGHEAPDLTDTIIVASIDPVNHKVALVSIPRDLWVSLPGHGSMKINAAYETGKFDYLGGIDSSNANKKAVYAGFATADQAVEQVLGITIHYNVLVNFLSFKKAVDVLGGITVDVPETLYDPSMAWENNWNATLAKKGVQKFNGKKALIYVRSRHTSSDFDRSNRQRAVITAIKDKAISLGTLSNPIKLTQLLSNFGDNVRTDLSIANASRVYDLTKDIQKADINSIGLGDKNKLVTTGSYAGQSIVMPSDGIGKYGKMQRYIRTQLPDGYIINENARIVVYNATGRKGFGDKETKNLTSYSYNVVRQEVYAKTLPVTRLVDMRHNNTKYTKNYLERHYKVQATTVLPEGVQPGTADFIIVLGTNETSIQ